MDTRPSLTDEQSRDDFEAEWAANPQRAWECLTCGWKWDTDPTFDFDGVGTSVENDLSWEYHRSCGHTSEVVECDPDDMKRMAWQRWRDAEPEQLECHDAADWRSERED